MKELTVAQGQLRCGECDSIFNAMDTLTTTLPKKLSEEDQEDNIDPDILTPKYTRTNTTQSINALHVFMVLFLLLLLLVQFLYINKRWFTHELKRSPELVQMISRNIISHPNDKGILLISASIENKSKYAQPYPYVEVTLLDNQNNIIALRRFKPIEYLLHTSSAAFPAKKEAILQLKIADPGRKATRFNFKFM
jgi:hypothetical protein